MVAGSEESDQGFTSIDSKATASASSHKELTAIISFDFILAQVGIDCVLREVEPELPLTGASQLLKVLDDTLVFSELCMAKKSDAMRAANSLDSRRGLAHCSNRIDLIQHCKSEQVGSGTVVDQHLGDVASAHVGGRT